jgi:hypothetical protein
MPVRHQGKAAPLFSVPTGIRNAANALVAKPGGIPEAIPVDILPSLKEGDSYCIQLDS